ncbi:MAG: hypothetical protein M3Y50_17205 [Acidobacteriota bacterium]|nr:hypothetical protein [Acidobacteriota bacterium]
MAPLSLLSALGFEALARRSRWLAASMVVLLTATFLVGDIRFFQKPREDWKSASEVLRTLAVQGGCLLFVPASSAEYYSFFDPMIAEHSCGSHVPQSDSVALAISPYAASGEIQRVRQLLQGRFTKKEVMNPQGPKIEVYVRSDIR